MILQLINYPVEGTVEQDQQKSPKRRTIIIKHFRNSMKIETNNLIFPFRSPKLISSKSSKVFRTIFLYIKSKSRIRSVKIVKKYQKQEQSNTQDCTGHNEITWLSDSNQIREHNQTFSQSTNSKIYFKLGSEQKNKVAIIKKVFKKEDEKDCLFLERKLSLLKFNLKEKEESQKVSIDYSQNKISQTAQSTGMRHYMNKNNKPQLFQNKINRRFNNDTDLQDQKPNRKKIISYSIRPNTHNNDRDHYNIDHMNNVLLQK